MKKIDITLELSNICNYRCDMCFLEEKDVIEKQFLKKSLAEKFISDLNNSEYSVGVLRTFWAGESTLHPNFEEIINILSQCEKIDRISFDTNASNLTESKVRCIINNLEKKFFNIIVSIDAFSEEAYSKIRVNGNLKEVQNNIKNLIQKIKMSQFKNKINLSIQFIVHPFNRGELRDFIDYWKKIFEPLEFNIMLNESMALKNGINIRPLTVQDERLNIDQKSANEIYRVELIEAEILSKDSVIKNLSQGGGNIEIIGSLK